MQGDRHRIGEDSVRGIVQVAKRDDAVAGRPYAAGETSGKIPPGALESWDLARASGLDFAIMRSAVRDVHECQ